MDAKRSGILGTSLTARQRKVVSAALKNDIAPALRSLHLLFGAPGARSIASRDGRSQRAKELAVVANRAPDQLEEALTYASAIAVARARLQMARSHVEANLGLSRAQAHALLFVALEHLDDDVSPADDLLMLLDQQGVDREQLARAAGRKRPAIRRAISRAGSRVRDRTP